MIRTLRNRLPELSVGYRRQKQAKRAGLYLATIVMSVVYVFPMYWMTKSAFQPSESLFEASVALRAIPHSATINNFERLLLGSQFVTFYKNSVIVVLGVMLLTVVVSTLAGYTLTRIDIRGKKTIANLTIFSYMYPPILLVMPMFLLWVSIGMTNTYIGLILAQSALTVPFSIWLMWQYFQTISISLEESAWIYGASRKRAFIDIALPKAMPGITAVAIFAFAVSWNDFTMSNIIMRETSMRTLPRGLLTFSQGYTIDWGLLMGASFLVAIPPFLLVYFLQKYLLQGFKIAN
jgi:multiple sugar transport system permease protein